MKRVVIVGCPGAGKTVFSKKLSKKTGLPIIHLDFYYHQLKYNYYSEKEAWVAKVKQLIKQDKWIMDGNYSSTFEPRFQRADTIIFLDFPRRTSVYRVLKRRIKYSKKLREEMPSDWKEKADKTFLKYVWDFPKESRVKIIEAVNKTKDKKAIVFKNSKEADVFLKML